MTDETTPAAAIEVVLDELRTFPPPDELQEGRSRRRHAPLRRGQPGLRGVLGPPGGRAPHLAAGVGHHPRVGSALREVVRRRPAQRLVQLPRPPRGGGQGRQGRLPLGRRAGRHPHAHLRRPPRRGAEAGQRPEVAGGRAGRPGERLPPDDPRAAGGAPGLRPHRGGPLRGVRRLLARLALRPDQRRRGQGPDHRRRRLASGCGRAAQGQQRRRRGGHAVDRARRRGAAHRQRRAHGARSRSLVPRPDGRGGARLPGRADGQRAAPVPALHLGHHGQAQGHHAHQRRLPHPGGLHPQVRVRPPARHRRVLVRGRHRLGDRPQLHRLRPPRQRRHQRHVRGHARSPGTRPVVGHHRALRRHDPLHRPHRHPHVHEVGRGRAGQARPLQPAPARLGRRADQPGSLDVVPRAHRRRSVPGGRHVVADRDGRHHDQRRCRGAPR